MSHDHCDCVEGLEEHVACLRDRLAEQDARGLRLAGENELLRGRVEHLTQAQRRCECGAYRALVEQSTEEVMSKQTGT